MIGRAAGFDAIPPEALIAGGSVVGEWKGKKRPTGHWLTALLAHRPPPQQHSTPHAAGILGLVGWQLSQQGGGMQAGQSEGAAAAAAPPPPPPPPREQAVLVLGATGRVGRRVVQKV